jgi:plastocyanin
MADQMPLWSLRSAFRTAVLGLLLAALWTCGGGSVAPSRLLSKPVGSGNLQAGTVGLALAESLRVLVTKDGTPLEGATVKWATPDGGALGPPTSLSDSSGRSAARWTLGTMSGVQIARASVSDAAGSPQDFLAEALPDTPTALVKPILSGDGQDGFSNRDLALPLEVKITDQFGNGVSGQNVGWSVTGDAALSASTTASGADGVAAVSVHLGTTTGPIQVTASAAGLANSPVTFTATNTGPLPRTASVLVGSVDSIYFRSARNGSTNPAVDTVGVSSRVTWNWVGGQHGVHPIRMPTFTGSIRMTGAGQSYFYDFTAPGTYDYNCLVHGFAMTGQIVVLP